MTGVNEIRRAFLEYFKAAGHEVVPSSPLVPRNDPSLMFTNAGMVQFKNVFTGQETRPYVRAASSQKCVRAGGKHNDLDNVGYTARHHTFFEMLGNFSFGDYFKERAIELAWNLITKEFGLDAKRLSVTVYHEDDEAHAIWKKLTGFGDDKLIRIATKDNFWQMGDTGPCGPCTEIFYDHGPKIPGGPPGSPDADGDRFIEIWNLVFMQFEQLPSGERINLPKASVDTGMGLERIAAVLQGTHDNYEIDLFRNLIATIRDECRKLGASDHPEGVDVKPARRVIADHLRATSFLIADGVLPSNEGRGYVLRRIMRRAMRYAHQLGCNDPLMYRLVPSLVREMGAAYPELGRAEALITETLKLEETKFKKTLGNGLKLLGEASASLKKGDVFPGDVAFKLYDTYGFPLDLTEDALRARDIAVDTKGFDSAMAKQKEEARRAWKGSGEAATEEIWFEIKEETGATEFLGYDTEVAEGEIRAIVAGGKPVKALKVGEEGALILNQTPFYGESGGQVGDEGVIRGAKGALFRVTDTQKKLGDLFVHFGKVEKGSFKSGEAVELEVDHERRTATRANHSATHLLHEALRQVLGLHVAQKGSLVSPERLRFDFVHQKPMTADEIAEVEKLANEIVLQNSPVETRLMALEDAKASGAMALFGEKYGDEVRVVSMGDAAPGANKAWSVELCGGTHARRTGDIGLVKVVAESASSAGVRRIEALTGDGARAYLAEADARLKEAAAVLKTRPEDLVERLKILVEERKTLERQLAEAKKQIALGVAGPAQNGASAPASAVRTVGDVKLLARSVQGLNPKDLRGLVDDGKKQVGSGVVAIVGVTEDGKAGLAVGVTEDLIKVWSAVDLVKVGAEALGGKGGGGRPDMAQAGGPDGAKAPDALAAIEARLGAGA
ncbi:alanine--tRNA ligase [Hyphomicrobium sp. DMF-1]|jgi:alanyl-tRNA synthetase|uniref:alanine--tRNA ligase n=1 Tax=Hyphomicrobium sp. DMF-1 TaxID=3019544 RepID=UPI0022EBCE47|nr:alanine--tRNA ligase [Hyphomicrobium sp. DMF-1]WBT36591.1 alanine--tRNA ligase [Hyphomicrobium sp. DMF-1]